MGKCFSGRRKLVQMEEKAPQRGMLPRLGRECWSVAPRGAPVLCGLAMHAAAYMQRATKSAAAGLCVAQSLKHPFASIFFATYWSILSSRQLYIKTAAM